MNETLYLDIENIKTSYNDIERHPLKPFIPNGCKVLFLGSFPPPQKRWCIPFYYPNFTNDHWRIEGMVFFDDKNHFVDNKHKCFKLDEIVHFLEEKGIGLYDTSTAVRRLKDNASDKYLEVVEQTDIDKLLLQAPCCKVVATTGEKATLTICNKLSIATPPSVGESATLPNDRILYRLPSSSRAYPLAIEKKAEVYKKMFRYANLL